MNTIGSYAHTKTLQIMQMGRGEPWPVSQWTRFVATKGDLPLGVVRDGGQGFR